MKPPKYISVTRIVHVCIVSLSLAVGLFAAKDEKPLLPNGWRVYDMERPLPVKVSPGDLDSHAPSDAIVLFDGDDVDKWEEREGRPVQWKVEKGYLEVVPGTGSLVTKDAFGDLQLHIEWATPVEVLYKGRKRGNSGIYLMGKYEIQIMDAWENTSSADAMAGAIYAQSPALVNSSKRPGKWQSFDIVFNAPVFEGEELVSPGRVTIFQNGVLIHNNTEIYGKTHHKNAPAYEAHPAKLPLMLQNHGSANRFRNIWLREL